MNGKKVLGGEKSNSTMILAAGITMEGISGKRAILAALSQGKKK